MPCMSRPLWQTKMISPQNYFLAAENQLFGKISLVSQMAEPWKERAAVPWRQKKGVLLTKWPPMERPRPHGRNLLGPCGVTPKWQESRVNHQNFSENNAIMRIWVLDIRKRPGCNYFSLKDVLHCQ